MIFLKGIPQSFAVTVFFLTPNKTLNNFGKCPSIDQSIILMMFFVLLLCVRFLASRGHLRTTWHRSRHWHRHGGRHGHWHRHGGRHWHGHGGGNWSGSLSAARLRVIRGTTRLTWVLNWWSHWWDRGLLSVDWTSWRRATAVFHACGSTHLWAWGGTDTWLWCGTPNFKRWRTCSNKKCIYVISIKVKVRKGDHEDYSESIGVIFKREHRIFT